LTAGAQGNAHPAIGRRLKTKIRSVVTARAQTGRYGIKVPIALQAKGSQFTMAIAAQGVFDAILGQISGQAQCPLIVFIAIRW